jgi:hypothetical protein
MPLKPMLIRFLLIKGFYGTWFYRQNVISNAWGRANLKLTARNKLFKTELQTNEKVSYKQTFLHAAVINFIYSLLRTSKWVYVSLQFEG